MIVDLGDWLVELAPAIAWRQSELIQIDSVSLRCSSYQCTVNFEDAAMTTAHLSPDRLINLIFD